MNLTDLTDEQLESAWQKSANEIEINLKSYYGNTGDNEQFRAKAEEAQNQQSEIQKEITRRH